jgi:hypothetical protein
VRGDARKYYEYKSDEYKSDEYKDRGDA